MGFTDKQIDKIIAHRAGKDCICGDCINRVIRENAKKN